MGLIAAIELVSDRATRQRFLPAGQAGKRGFALCLEEGLIARSIREALALCPPLSIRVKEIDELVARLRRALERLSAELLG